MEATSATETAIYLRGDLGAKGGTVDLDPGISIKNAKGLFIAKYSLSTTSPKWSPNWVGSIGVEGGSSGSTVTDANSLYVLGSFQGTQDFDPSSGTMNLTSAGDNDGFVAKYDKITGTLVWAKRYGGTGLNERFYSGIVVQDKLYLSFIADTASLDFNPGVPGGDVVSNGAGTYSVLLKLDANGAYQQVWQMGGTNSADFLRSYVIGIFGTSVYVAGHFLGTANFPNGGPLASAGLYDIFLMALEDPMLAPVPAPALASTSTGARSVENSTVDAALSSLIFVGYYAVKSVRLRQVGNWDVTMSLIHNRSVSNYYV